MSHSVNLIGAETVIRGEVETDGDIRIDGKVEGSVTSRAKVVIGENGKVEGKIFCQNADIAGKLEGDLYSDELLHLKNNGIIEGNIHVNKLIIESGSTFNGKCEMGAGMVENYYEVTGENETGKQEGKQEEVGQEAN